MLRHEVGGIGREGQFSQTGGPHGNAEDLERAATELAVAGESSNFIEGAGIGSRVGSRLSVEVRVAVLDAGYDSERAVPIDIEIGGIHAVRVVAEVLRGDVQDEVVARREGRERGAVGLGEVEREVHLGRAGINVDRVGRLR